MLHLSDQNFIHPETKLYRNNAQFQAFPNHEEVKFNNEQFFAIGKLNVKDIVKDCADDVFLGYPPSEWLAEQEYITYALIDGQWQLDVDDLDEWEFDFEDEQARYDDVKAFHNEHGFIQYHPNDEPDESRKSGLVNIGGQAPTGWNWDAYLWENEEESDALFDASEDKESEESQAILKRAIIMKVDGDIYHYIAHVQCMNYAESSADLIYFYNPQKKRVVMGVDYS
ncbi:MAG: hypothetical protein ACPGSN_08610 [Psychrobium sp.]